MNEEWGVIQREKQIIKQTTEMQLNTFVQLSGCDDQDPELNVDERQKVRGRESDGMTSGWSGDRHSLNI